MNNNQYQTTSLALAAAIQLGSSNKLQSIETSPDSRKAVFVFSVTPELNSIIQHFWERSLPLDAFSYFEAIKYLKTRLYETKEGLQS